MIADRRRLVAGVLDGDPRAIARSISMVEAEGAAGADVIKGVFRQSGRATLLGVTGAPGVGKSSLVDRLVTTVRGDGRTVGVLAIDPTSPFSGGAVLGDRVRMQTHIGDVGVFVRSMATRGELGGLARATGDAVVVLDAAGFDLIVIETVGVGQAEVEISRTADMTVVVTMPGAGDGVQALKAGVMEIADLFVVNKADHDGADRAVAEIQTMLGLHTYQPEEWRPPVLQTRATDGTGVPEVLRMIDAYCARVDNEVGRRRRARFEARVRHLVAERLLRHVEQQALEPGAFARILDQVVATEVDPYTAAEEIVRQAVNTTSPPADTVSS
jgi:LAO/AO transport system kinase